VSYFISRQSGSHERAFNAANSGIPAYLFLHYLVWLALDSLKEKRLNMHSICRERLARIQRVLNQNGGAVTVRDFARTFSVWEWELEKAAELGWIQIETRKPHTGRPSRIVREVSQPYAAKLPPYRRQIEKPISFRHFLFALFSTMAAIKGGSSWAGGMPCFTDAYLKAFPAAKNRRAAAASMSRLLRRNDVKAASAWHYARLDGDVPRDEPMPRTVSGIIERLRQAGSWRVRA
jgi:hypothetical protein